VRQTTLLVVPTSGNRAAVANDGKVAVHPGAACQQRLETAAKRLSEDGQAKLAIVGGWRAQAELSEAAVAKRWFLARFPEHSDRMAFIQSEGCFTAEDMIRLARKLHSPEWAGAFVLLVSHPDHALLAAQTLRSCGIDKVDFLDSGERPPYGAIKLAVLKLIYSLDPLWISAPARVVARLVSERRGGGF